MKRLEAKHYVISAFILLGAILLLLVNAVVASLIPQWLSGLLSNVATALLALAVIELVFKLFLQRNLIRDLVAVFKTAINLPVRAVYLRRASLPTEQDPIHIIQSAQRGVYVKGISFAKLVAEGFANELRTALRHKPEISVHFLILSPDFQDLDGVSSLTGLSVLAIQENIRQFSRQLDSLREEGLKVAYAFHDKFPTIGCWLVDPDHDNAWCRIEVYLYHGEHQASRANFILACSDEPNFFRRFATAVIEEWKQCSSVDLETVAPSAIGPREPTDRIASEGSPARTAIPIRKVVDADLSSWPATSAELICLTFPTTNLSEMRQFYSQHDSRVGAGVRGADSIPPRTATGILRLVVPSLPDDFIDVMLPRPTGFIYDAAANRFIVACQGDNSIVEISSSGIRQLFTHPLFNHLHSIDLHENLLAVASSGTDMVLVFDMETRQEVFRWIAMENGYETRPSGQPRSLDTRADHRTRFYPTLEQATHLNSVVLSRSESSVIYASLFHQGEIIRIDMEKETTDVALAGLDHPHGLKTDGNGGYIHTSASSGRISILNPSFACIASLYDPSVEWLQDACGISRGLYAYTDANKALLRLVDIGSRNCVGAYAYEGHFKVYQVRSTGLRDFAQFEWMRSF